MFIGKLVCFAVLLSHALLIESDNFVECSKNHTPDGNGYVTSSLVFQRFPEPALVPWPKQITADNQYLELGGQHGLQCILIEESSWASCGHLAILLANEVAAITNIRLQVVNESSQRSFSRPCIRLQISRPTLPPRGTQTLFDASHLVINSTGVTVSANGYGGLVSGTATLIQALEHTNDVDWIGPNGTRGTTQWNCSTPVHWRIPYLDVNDGAEFGYRGAMVDAARAVLTLTQLKQYVVVCRMYKLDALHIHFSDDDAFTWPSTAFPQLSNKSTHAYTLAEMQELAAFARVRGVMIVGEIDVPGHSTGIVHAAPDLFAFNSTPTLGIIDLTSAAVIGRVQTIYDEIAAVFPSPFVHIGGDEVNFGALERVPEVQDFIKSKNYSSVTDVYRNFIAEMDAYATARGRTLHVWEGFAPSSGQSGRSTQPASNVSINPTSGITVQPFDCYYYPPPQLAEDGYHIVNSAWSPLYVANGHGEATELIYRWNPYLFGEVHDHLSWWRVATEHRSAVVGVEMAVWSTGGVDTLAALAERVPAMSDRSWNPMAMRTYADFLSRYAATNAKLQVLLPVAPPPPPAPKPTPGGTFAPQAGACRDQNGQHGQRLEHNGKILFSACRDRCIALGERCDAYDIDGQPPEPRTDPYVAWCGVWGMTLNASDASGYNGTFTFVNDGTGTRVCHGSPAAGSKNTCYPRPPLC
eukprot:m.692170 g.692170  ORF g.692170 m.692170 type:complete len:696 (+) comp22859_c0_seq13:228-2315(+)